MFLAILTNIILLSILKKKTYKYKIFCNKPIIKIEKYY